MIRYVKLYNYKSLKALDVDFMGTKNNPKNLILIYGENGVGKTNFVNSFYTLKETMDTKINIDKLQGILEDLKKDEDNVFKDIRKSILSDSFKDIKKIIDDCKTIDSFENLILEYGFQIDGKDGSYRIEMNDEEIVTEKLEYVLNKNKTCYFHLSMDDKGTIEGMRTLGKLFTDSEYHTEFVQLIEKYWGKHSLMAILSHEFWDKKRGYPAERIIDGLTEVFEYLDMICSRIKGEGDFGSYSMRSNILRGDLIRGKINKKHVSRIDNSEKILNTFFTSLYSDIKSVYYEREVEQNVIKYNLFLKKLIYGQILDIDFRLESTGTKNLVNLLPYLISVYEGQTIVIDELDTGIHDILVNNIVNGLVDGIKGQLIATTHNTMLIESAEIDNESIYVFNVDKNGNKELFPITEFERIQDHHNAKKRYLSGLYGGIPSSGAIDFADLINDLQSE